MTNIGWNSKIERFLKVLGAERCLLIALWQFSFWIIIYRRFRWTFYSTAPSFPFLPLFDKLPLTASTHVCLWFINQVAQLLDIIIELVMLTSKNVSFLFQMLIIVLENLLTYLTVIRRWSQFLNYLNNLNLTADAED